MLELEHGRICQPPHWPHRRLCQCCRQQWHQPLPSPAVMAPGVACPITDHTRKGHAEPSPTAAGLGQLPPRCSPTVALKPIRLGSHMLRGVVANLPTLAAAQSPEHILLAAGARTPPTTTTSSLELPSSAIHRPHIDPATTTSRSSMFSSCHPWGAATREACPAAGKAAHGNLTLQLLLRLD
jgi:hypothetical protein